MGVLALLVRLPVRTALLQNVTQLGSTLGECDYQSERHCSKTVQNAAEENQVRLPVRTALLQNYR